MVTAMGRFREPLEITRRCFAGTNEKGSRSPGMRAWGISLEWILLKTKLSRAV